jgi:hypothetical protein
MNVACGTKHVRSAAETIDSWMPLGLRAIWTRSFPMSSRIPACKAAASLLEATAGGDDVPYNEAGVEALDKVREVIVGFRLLLAKARKFNSIVSAIEMQIEVFGYCDEVVTALERALLGTADFYKLAEQDKDKLVTALIKFQSKIRRG